MMSAMGAVALVLATLSVGGVGWISGAPWSLGRRTRLVECLALRVLVGMFLVGIALVLTAVLRVRLSMVPLALVAAAGFGLLLRWRLGRPAAPRELEPMTRQELLAWGMLALILGLAFVRAWVVPEGGWDAYSHWGLKAKAYFLADRIVDVGTAHEYYPPLVPLLETWFYELRGGVSIDDAKVLWAVFGTAFAIALAWHGRLTLHQPSLGPLLAAGILMGTVQLVENFWTGQADLALTAFLTLSALALFQWQRAPGSERRAWLAQAALFAAGAALTKHEGLFRAGIVLAAFAAAAVLRRDQWRASLTALLVTGSATALCFAPWAIFRVVNHIEVGPEHLYKFQFDAVGKMFVALGEVLAGVRTGGGLAAAALGMLIVGRRVLQPPYLFPVLAVVGQVAATLLAFLVSQTPAERQVWVASTRLIMQFTPLALFVAGACLAEVLQNETSSQPAVAPAAAAAREREVVTV